MAIFITGGTHGDFTRFKKEIFRERAGLTKGHIQSDMAFVLFLRDWSDTNGSYESNGRMAACRRVLR